MNFCSNVTNLNSNIEIHKFNASYSASRASLYLNSNIEIHKSIFCLVS